MPTMMEIYAKHAVEYDELVNHEDFKGNLKAFLNDKCEFKGKRVIEFGTGTGRLTQMYIDSALSVQCFDRSQHMLDKAKQKLALSKNVIFSICDNTEISDVSLNADIVLEGWSFGHTVADNSDDIPGIVEKLVSSCKDRLLDKGTIIFIETLGTNAELPQAPTDTLGSFYQLLEEVHGFSRTVLNTDYKFGSDDEAVRIMSYFFGSEFGKCLQFRGEGIVKEFTGVWTFSN